ncbi:MAG: type II TA system antitoxin MqsA family protein [Caulobacteraceae bacterium]
MNSEKSTRPCPCRGGVMRRGARPETVSFRGESLTYEQPGWHCDACDDGILEGADNEYHDAALVMARAKGSPISPLMVRAARDGVSQREAGRVFGGGPTAFYKYETAKAVPSEGMAKLPRIAIERPDVFHGRPGPRSKGMTGDDTAMLRQRVRDSHLGAILERVYPAGPGR